jgi:hypothetical protein
VSKGKNKILSVIIFRSEIYDAIRCNSITWKIHIFFPFQLKKKKIPFKFDKLDKKIPLKTGKKKGVGLVTRRPWVLRRPMVVVGLVKHQNPLQFIGKKRKKKRVGLVTRRPWVLRRPMVRGGPTWRLGGALAPPSPKIFP